MLSIAIVEDDAKDVERLINILKQYQSETGEVVKAQHFHDAEAFLTRYKAAYDIVFLDIVLGSGSLNGMDAAKRLRKLDQHVAIIFTTSMARYAVNGYEVDALDFLLKPLDYYKVKMRLDRYCRNKVDKKIYVILNTAGNLRRISASEIYYVEVLSHTLLFHTTSGDISGRGTMRDVEKVLTPAGFARCSISHLVNLNYFNGIKGNALYIGKYELHITRGKKKQFMQEISQFLSRGV